MCLQVLVDTLANNKAFQRFAIRSNALFSDMSKKTTEHGSDVGQKSAEFFSVFKEEVCCVREMMQTLCVHVKIAGGSGILIYCVLCVAVEERHGRYLQKIAI